LKLWLVQLMNKGNLQYKGNIQIYILIQSLGYSFRSGILLPL
jgi:hypothetical protein